MKKLINEPGEVLKDALHGFSIAHADLVKVHFEPNFITRADAPVQGKVALVSGGGAGHEPMHGGFVGRGMLDAAVPGAVFTAPASGQIYAAVQAVDGGAGVLQIIKNYTGDLLNFEMAAMMAEGDDIEMASVIVNDDVAVEDSTFTAGRRGTGVTLLVQKIAGAAAEAGYSLAEVKAVAERVINHGRSMGMALTSCTVPHIGSPNFEIADDEMELGIGIHGEPGRKRIPLQSAAETARLLAEPILKDLPFSADDEVLVFVNGLGSTPDIELYIMYNELAKICAEKGIIIKRSLVGSYVTSLEMAGCTFSLLKLDDELTTLWDAAVQTPALNW